MSTNRLQLRLIAEEGSAAQPLPQDIREKCVELIAAMLLRLIRLELVVETEECRDESR